MKKLNVTTKYSSDIRLVSSIRRFLNTLLIIGAVVFLLFGITEDAAYLIGTAACLVLLFAFFVSSAKLSALAGVAKAAEYYMAVIEQEYSINEINEDSKLEKFVNVKESKPKEGRTSLPFKEGDFVFCEPKGCVVVVLSINKNNTVTCGMEDEDGKMTTVGTFKENEISSM